MRESKERIIEYTKALVGLKEKVVAVAILFAVSAVMMISVSFAWFTLSKNPELSGVTTSITGNGNLEIALATGSSSSSAKPAESAVGDSNKPLVDKNITWGNLINLSDPAYGLDQLVLRPATINKSSLLESPLYGAEYTPDGRISRLVNDLKYATWDSTYSKFMISDLLGVRAITSTKMDEANEYQTNLHLKKSQADALNAAAMQGYMDIINNTVYMDTLATLMGQYMTVKMNSGQGEDLTNPTISNENLTNLSDIFNDFIKIMKIEEEALVALANYQLYVLNSGETSKYQPYTVDSLFEEKDSLAEGVQITELNSFYNDLALLELNYQHLLMLKEAGDIKWEYEPEENVKLNVILDSFVNVLTCEIDGTPVNNIGASNATQYLNGIHNAVITNGIIWRFEKRTGAAMNVGSSDYYKKKGIPISATMRRKGFTVPATIYVYITTNAGSPCQFSEDLSYVDSMNKGGYATLQAKDTIGMAVDLWVRTNQYNSYLTLQGNVLFKEEEITVTATNEAGIKVDVYTADIFIVSDDGEKFEYTEDVYKDGDNWYTLSGSLDVTENLKSEPIRKKEISKTPIGYEGEDRIWSDGVGLTVSGTKATQGSGSCYTYYADTPEEQAKSLSLLNSMKVAFVDDRGNLLAAAEMDTDNYYADSGKVIVPLVLDESKSDKFEDVTGAIMPAIMPLERNVPTRITVIVYLEGIGLTNGDVLASSDIQGQLNIQFGSCVQLMPIKNENLASKYIDISASVSEDSFNYDDASDDNPMTTIVSVKIAGIEASSVSAFFMRKINSTQGSREVTVNFDKADSNMWVADYTFLSPGNYVLRSVFVDGVEYELKEKPVVVIEGFTIESISWAVTTGENAQEAVIMTADTSYSVPIEVKFATNDIKKLPGSVKGRFLREDGTAVSIDFVFDSTRNIWKGNAKFATSGEYTLQYLILDGEYNEISPEKVKYITVYLGMKVAVYTSSIREFKYDAESMREDGTDFLKMNVVIMDDIGQRMEGLEDVLLSYKLDTSNEDKMTTDLKWNPNTEYYEGEFNALEGGPGVHIFKYVKVGENSITNCMVYPAFTITSPNPPSFYKNETSQDQFSPNNDARFSVDIAYTEAAKSYSTYIKNVKTGEVYEIIDDGTKQSLYYVSNQDKILVNSVNYNTDGTLPSNAFIRREWNSTLDDSFSYSNWSIVIPKNYSGTYRGYQDGYWQLLSISMTNVYDNDGNRYTDENPYIIDLESQNISTRVVSKLSFTLSYTVPEKAKVDNKPYNYTLEGEFMDSYTISDIRFAVSDFEGKAIQINNFKLGYTYDGDSITHGGYTGGNCIMTSNTISFVSDSIVSSDKIPSKDLMLQLAGGYEFDSLIVTFVYGDSTDPKTGTITLEGKENIQALVSNLPSFTVESVHPSVNITEIRKEESGDTYSGEQSITDNNKTATVVAGEYKTETTVCGSTIKYNAYHQPYVTITLDGIGKATSAKLVFSSNSDKVHMYVDEEDDESKSVSSYEWSSDGDVTRYIGLWDSRTGDDKWTPAGVLTSGNLILVVSQNGTTTEYTVPGQIIIKNTLPAAS